MTPFAAESARCRAAQAGWATCSPGDRLRPVREFRHLLVERADELTAAVRDDVARPPDEVVATDLLPTAAAAKFLQANARRILAPRRVGGRPLWLIGCRDTVYRRPHGVVGLIGTWNYPVFLTAVPVLHALAAGNGVLWKPSEQTPRTAAVLHDLFLRAGFPPNLLVLLPGTREAGPLLAEADVDFVHFTGSETVGRKLAARLGERLVPSALELSGCDAMIVLPDADVAFAARSAWYGATLNAGQTCMATRRAFVPRATYGGFVDALKPLAAGAHPVRLVLDAQAEQARRLVAEAADRGCTVLRSAESSDPAAVLPAVILGASPDMSVCREVSFAPLLAVIPYDTVDSAIAMHNDNPFGLAAAVFAGDPAAGVRVAERLRAGSVVVNDVIVPTAHPATPFGGRGASGWGVTQGEEGLLQMTVPQVVSTRAGTFRPHVDALLTRDPSAGDVARGALRLVHARTLGDRWRGLKQLVRGIKASGGR
ncbi:aldehyde dehydrogenase family protein [Fimbriiglobus ruber]|uniref:Aldehyde dehydrogenase n=1 Tax=Fimbriiglobus ruber TaxID=1908690 RepID=A0A225DW62_9BACT|nr:aldehyde dehydrogenase family protein [Fimbriiglobus ruber]OWK45622.1 Aldehyde dehydrogenase [Fimbriiglobus ruber]